MRLAGVSALLTFVILCAFALAVGSLTVDRIRSDFNRQVLSTAEELPTQLEIGIDPLRIEPPLADLAPAKGHAIIRVFTLDGRLVTSQPSSTPALGDPREGARNVHGYRVISRLVPATSAKPGNGRAR